MQEQINNLTKQVSELQKQVESLTQLVKQTADTSFKTSAREIVNREVQFLQRVYDKNGGIVTEINA
jgi:outer membrane murein-binding lipoprotein Lpp